MINLFHKHNWEYLFLRHKKDEVRICYCKRCFKVRKFYIEKGYFEAIK